MAHLRASFASGLYCVDNWFRCDVRAEADASMKRRLSCSLCCESQDSFENCSCLGFTAERHCTLPLRPGRDLVVSGLNLGVNARLEKCMALGGRCEGLVTGLTAVLEVLWYARKSAFHCCDIAIGYSTGIGIGNGLLGVARALFALSWGLLSGGKLMCRSSSRGRVLGALGGLGLCPCLLALRLACVVVDCFVAFDFNVAVVVVLV